MDDHKHAGAPFSPMSGSREKDRDVIVNTINCSHTMEWPKPYSPTILGSKDKA